MKQRRLGRTGLEVSELCLGTMTFAGQSEEPASFAMLDLALERGVTFFDLADVYPIPVKLETVGRTESLFGRWLASRRVRDRIVVATKCRFEMGPGPNDVGLSRRHVLAAVEASLRRLGIDAIDLYQVHGPDPVTPVEETLTALDDLVHAGKVRYLGCSNFRAWELALADEAALRRGVGAFQCIQPRYNLLERSPERDLLPYSIARGVGVIPYNAQAGGFLTGKYQPSAAPAAGTRFSDQLAASAKTYRGRYWKEDMFAAVREITQLAAALGCTPGQLAIAWLLAQPGITAPIIGATSTEQLAPSLAAADLTLDAATLARLKELTDRFV